MNIWIAEDEYHDEPCGEYANFENALEELRKRSTIPWKEKPNRPPCGNLKCHRDYEIVEYDKSKKPWEELSRTPIFQISSKGIVWEDGYKPKEKLAK